MQEVKNFFMAIQHRYQTEVIYDTLSKYNFVNVYNGQPSLI